MTNEMDLKSTEKDLMNKLNKYEELDLEWLYLILEARKLGIPTQEIREFLRSG